MRIKDVSMMLACSTVIATLAASPAVADSSALPTPDTAAVRSVQKTAVAQGASSVPYG
ncbi:hypothetical protein [Streptomyces sp. HC307]|uniref:hypothetical protein n=1 Tax=Streptomyces flavusporus TaxID=3385496 RepID=UPI003916EC01